MLSSRRITLSIVCSVLLVLLGTNANAADYHWQGAGTGGNTATDPTDPTTQWDNPANWWEGSIPGPDDTAYIALTNRGYCNVMSGTGAQTVWVEVEGITPEGALHIGDGMCFRVKGKEYVANRATGKIVQSGGNHRVFYEGYGHASVYLGYASGSSGTYELSGGNLTVEQVGTSYNGEVYVGYNGTGTFLQTGGTHNVHNADYSGRGQLYVSYNSESTGLYSLAGGQLTVDGTEYIGYRSAGEFVQTGGTNTAEEIYLAKYCSSSGSYELSGDGSVSATKLTMAYDGSSGASATASFSIAGTGSVSVSELIMACDYYNYSHYSTANFSLSELGSLTARQEVIGQEGEGTFIQSGGTHTVTSIMTLGYESTAVGMYDLTGGLLNPSGMTLGLNGTGSCTQSGGTNSVAGELHLGHNSGGEGTYNLSDEGTLNVGTSEYVGLRGTGTMTQTGGTHTVTERLCLGYDTGSSGTLDLRGGSLVVRDLHVGRLGYGELDLSSGAYLEIGGAFTFGGNSRFFAESGSEIHMTGAAFRNESTNSANLAGLENLTLIFEGGSGVVHPFEAAARDGGLGLGSFSKYNFLLDTLQLGGTAAGKIQLVDDFDNQDVGEAVYVNNLIMNAGATIDLNGLNLYYLNGGDPKQFFCGDATLDGVVDQTDLNMVLADWGQTVPPAEYRADLSGDYSIDQADLNHVLADWGKSGMSGGESVPEPATMLLLALGGLGMLKRRR